MGIQMQRKQLTKTFMMVSYWRKVLWSPWLIGPQKYFSVARATSRSALIYVHIWKLTSQPTRDADPLLAQCWASVANGGPTLNLWYSVYMWLQHTEGGSGEDCSARDWVMYRPLIRTLSNVHAGYRIRGQTVWSYIMICQWSNLYNLFDAAPVQSQKAVSAYFTSNSDTAFWLYRAT